MLLRDTSGVKVPEELLMVLAFLVNKGFSSGEVGESVTIYRTIKITYINNSCKEKFALRQLYILHF